MKSARTGGHTAFLPLLCLPGSTNSITLGGGRLAIFSLKEPTCTTTTTKNPNMLHFSTWIHKRTMMFFCLFVFVCFCFAFQSCHKVMKEAAFLLEYATDFPISFERIRRVSIKFDISAFPLKLWSLLLLATKYQVENTSISPHCSLLASGCDGLTLTNRTTTNLLPCYWKHQKKLHRIE